MSWRIYPRSLYPRSLGGQLLTMLIVALAVTQALSLFLLTDERNRAVRAALGLEAAGRAANVALLLERAPENLHADILRSADSPLVRFSIGPEPAVDGSSNAASALVARVRGIMDAPNRDVRADLHAFQAMVGMSPNDIPVEMRPMHQAMLQDRTEPVELSLAIQLADNSWLNVRTMFHRPDLQFSPTDLAPLLLMGLAVALVALFTARRVVVPIRTLAEGASRLGRGIASDPLPVTGPTEVRDMTEAFNLMQDRLARFVADRTRMLAALSHDLRSPLTAMRLRVEMLDETEDSTRLRALIDEMQVMVEATLDFARGAAESEPATELDMGTLLADLVDEAIARGEDARLLDAPDLRLTVRPIAIRRALRNLIENAARYGGNARVSLSVDDDAALITIADDGPGLPEDQIERAFDPFVRLETSRSRDTGGVGLGLAIARSIIRAHGGDVTLANRPEGGCMASVHLPLAT